MDARALFFLPCLVLLSGCPGTIDHPERFGNMTGTGTTAACALNLNVETDIFATKCNTVACHEGGMSVSQLDLTSPGVAKRLVDRPSNSCAMRTIVTRSAPDMSVLLDRLNPNPVCGVRMPLGRTPLMQGEIDCVKAWVTNAVHTSSAAMGM